jgi:hypothetical protein
MSHLVYKDSMLLLLLLLLLPLTCSEETLT